MPEAAVFSPVGMLLYRGRIDDRAIQAGLPVRGIGKISDIFAGSGITDSTPTKTNAEGMAAIARLWSETKRGLLFANLVAFDTLFGHRRDPAGYAQALAEFDAWLPPFLEKVTPDDLVVITADTATTRHGAAPACLRFGCAITRLRPFVTRAPLSQSA